MVYKSQFFKIYMKLIKFIGNRVVETTMKFLKKTAIAPETVRIITYPSPEESIESFLKPLPSNFYSNLLRLEEKIQRKDFTENTINEIILLYAVKKKE